MKKQVILAKNPLEPETWTQHEVDDLHDFLREELGSWPKTARIYRGSVCTAHDITPKTEAEAKALRAYSGEEPLFVVILPEDLVTIIIAVVAVIAVVAIAFLFPRIPNLSNAAPGSANNSLSSRTNEARLNARIPDIFGAVRSFPDLLTTPYIFYQNNVQVEISYMCVGRGTYLLEDARDGGTRLQEIAGAAAEFYGPDTSPNSGDSPQVQIGDAIDLPVLSVGKMNDVNGQALRPPNFKAVRGNDDLRFVYPDIIEVKPGSTIDFTETFENGQDIDVGSASFGGSSGTVSITSPARFLKTGVIEFQSYDPTALVSALDELTISAAGFAGLNNSSVTQYVDLSGTYTVTSVNSTSITLQTPASVNSDWSLLDDYPADRTEYRSATFATPVETSGLDLAGTYTIVSVSSTQLGLSNPATVNAAWANIASLPGGVTDYGSPSIATTGDNWVGPFTARLRDGDRLLVNLVGRQGAYQVNEKGTQYALSISAEVEVTPVDEDGAPTGSPETYTIGVTGSKESRDSVGESIWTDGTLPASDNYSVRMRRTTYHDYDYKGTLVDEIRWESCYVAGVAPETHYGDVTTVLTKTYATEGALSLKQRKFSVLATRRLPQRISGTTFTSTLYPTLNVADMLVAAALDPKIGNRQMWELDIEGIYSAMAEVEAYFGTPEAAQFCYTFDQADMSFEETAQAMAQAAFCTAYRQGSVISLRFEKPTDDSVLLLNHRNKQPGTETRTVTFGISDGYDGVSLAYVDPVDDAPLTMFVPQGDASAVKPKKIETIGLRSEMQAHFHAWRAWNKLKYQHESLEVTAEEEADAVVLTERVLAADNTRSDVQDGEVLTQTGLMLELSQPVEMEEGEDYVIFLQLSDGTVQRIAITAGTHNDEVVLATPPSLPLVLDDESYARTTYVVASSLGSRAATPFILTEKDPLENGRYQLRAINYDERYYANDLDFIE